MDLKMQRPGQLHTVESQHTQQRRQRSQLQHLQTPQPMEPREPAPPAERALMALMCRRSHSIPGRWLLCGPEQASCTWSRSVRSERCPPSPSAAAAAAAAARFFGPALAANLAYRAGLAGAGSFRRCLRCPAGPAGRAAGRSAAAPAASTCSFPIIAAAPLRCSAPLLCSAAPSKESSGCADLWRFMRGAAGLDHR